MENNIRFDFVRRKINSLYDMLTKTEQKIAGLLLENPEEFIYLSVNGIAEKSGTSISAVTRFAKKLGYDGVPSLKLSLSQEVNQFSFLDDIDLQDKTPTIMKKVFNANIEALNDTLKVLKPEEIDKAVDFIQAASRVAFFGIGGSASVATDAHHKMIRTGKTVEVYTDPHKQMIFSALAKEDDVIIAISHEGASVDLNKALTVAKNNGAKIIAITQFSISPITKIADISLFTLSRETLYRPESLTSRVAAHTITDLLYVSYSLRIHEQMNRNIAKIRDAMKSLKEL